MDLDKIIKRRNTGSYKWDCMKESFKCSEENVIPMWVADMDFANCEVIEKAVANRLKTGNLGYGDLSDYPLIVKQWLEKRYNLSINEDWVVYCPGIVTAISILLSFLTKKDDKVLIQSPVYHSFYRVVKKHNCEVIENQLVITEENKYAVDFIDFEEKLKLRPKLFILCSPHNPVGRVWKNDELEKMVELCRKYNVTIISDEIHGDITLRNNKHKSLLSFISEDNQNIIVCSSPSKSFNIPSLYMSNIIIPNMEMRGNFKKVLDVEPNLLGYEAMKAAYSEGEPWLCSVLRYIDGNYQFIKQNINEKIKVTELEGTYLLWLNCRELNLKDEQLLKFFVDDCRIAVNAGQDFGKGGSGFVRMNIACPRSTVEESVKRINDSLCKLF